VYPPAYTYSSPGIGEWLISGVLAKANLAVIIRGAIPIILCLHYTIVAPNRRDEIKGSLLAIGFFFILLFIHIACVYGYFLLPLRRIFTAMGIFIIYSGYTIKGGF
jgi:hypothetical protein